MLPITRITRQDYDQILADVDDFWGLTNDQLLYVHHPIFLYEFGDTAFAAKDQEKVAAYQLGFVSQTDPCTAYAHALACRPDYRGLGVVEALMRRFAAEVRARGCTRVKLLAYPKNLRLVLFYLKLGFVAEGTERDANGVRVVRDYWGPGIDYTVMWRDLQDASALLEPLPGQVKEPGEAAGA
jgi:ribosomal protein S18 acetylase RimI-like enzyme